MGLPLIQPIVEMIDTNVYLKVEYRRLAFVDLYKHKSLTPKLQAVLCMHSIALAESKTSIVLSIFVN